jgi:hypothetical protein
MSRSIVSIGAAVTCCLALEARQPDATRALALAQEYLAAWQEQLSAIVGEEEYEQRVERRHMSEWSVRQVRILRSDVLLVKAPADHRWLCFRDVLSADGRLLPDRQDRFDALFTSPAASLVADAQSIADESARFNLGMYRTLNTPIAGLIYLTHPFASSAEWRVTTNQRLRGARAWALSFTQDKPPFVVQNQGSTPLSSSGRIWLEPLSGRILRTEFAVHISGRPRVTTDFAYVAAINAWAPVRMEDQFNGFERVSGVAAYARHRAFRTGARIIRPGTSPN